MDKEKQISVTLYGGDEEMEEMDLMESCSWNQWEDGTNGTDGKNSKRSGWNNLGMTYPQDDAKSCQDVMVLFRSLHNRRYSLNGRHGHCCCYFAEETGC